jgi:biopolymer transport protein ExbB/TolQ
MNPYTTPPAARNAEGNSRNPRQRRFWLRVIWISIAGVLVPPLFGLAGTVAGMVGAFGELSQTGEADPSALAGDISTALLTTIWGLGLSALAFVVLVVAVVRFMLLPKPEKAD